MNKKDLTEADIRTKFITPAIVGPNGSKWKVLTQIRAECFFTKGRVMVCGKTVKRAEEKKADYVLHCKPNMPIAVIEAKDNNHSLGAVRSPRLQSQIERSSKQSAQANLFIEPIRRLVVPIPPLAEQRRIVAKVEQLMALVDALEQQLAASRATAANLLSTLVTELTRS